MKSILLICFIIIVSLLNIVKSRLHEDREDVTLLPLSRGMHLPLLGLGTAGLRHDTSKIVLTALNAGIRLIDTAQAVEWYDEEQVGLGLREFLTNNIEKYSLDDVVLVTKVHPRFFEFKKMDQRLQQSTRFLHGEENFDRPLDIVLIHAPRCWSGHCNEEEESHTWQEAWRNLEQFKAEGKILEIGVSNFDYDELREVMSMSNTKIAIVQNWMDPLHQDRATRELAQANGIAYMAYSSYGTQWQGKRKLGEPDNLVLQNKELLRIAEKHDRTVPAVINSWLTQLKVVAIPRSSSQDHVIENAQHSEFLDHSDMIAIEALDGSAGTPWD